MLAFLSGLGSKAWGYMVAAGAAVALVAAIFWRGQKAGEDKAAAQQQEQDAKTRSRFDEVDRQPVDFDAAVGRLRDRAKR